jgi:hypothetical protein
LLKVEKEMNMLKQDKFRTSDIYLASAVLVNGAELIGIENDPRNPQRKVFVLKSTAETTRIVRDFSENALIVHLRDYLTAWRGLRRKLN